MEKDQRIILELMKSINLFAGLRPAAILELSRICKEKSFRRGEVVFEEGSPGNSMMVIISGEIRISQKFGMKEEEALTVLKSGDFFGEMALLEDLPRTATAIAHSDAYLLEMSRANFLQFIQKDSHSGVAILLTLARILSSRLRETDTKVRAFLQFSQWA